MCRFIKKKAYFIDSWFFFMIIIQQLLYFVFLQSDSLSLLERLGLGGWRAFLLSALCDLLSSPCGWCALLHRWTSIGSLFGCVFFNSSLCNTCLSDRSLRKSSSYTFSCTVNNDKIVKMIGLKLFYQSCLFLS